MKNKNFFIISMTSLVVLSLTILFFLSFLVIYSGVKIACLKAKAEYHQDCVNSLIEVVKSDKYSFRERNSAIWALGQLADKKVLPFLYELNQSLPEQSKCEYNQFLCKYEVQKAIKWCSSGNVTSWMYKNREGWR